MRILLTLALVYVAMAADDKAGSLLKRLVNLLEAPGQTRMTDLSKRDNVPTDKKQIADDGCYKLCKDKNPVACQAYKVKGWCKTYKTNRGELCVATCMPYLCPPECKKQFETAELDCDKLCKDLKPGMCSSVKAKGHCDSLQGELCVATCFPNRCPDSCKS